MAGTHVPDCALCGAGKRSLRLALAPLQLGFSAFVALSGALTTEVSPPVGYALLAAAGLLALCALGAWANWRASFLSSALLQGLLAAAALGWVGVALAGREWAAAAQFAALFVAPPAVLATLWVQLLLPAGHHARPTRQGAA